ncbi:hypothetical protein [Xanthobacter flavus]|uniref:hypothetical protein n=1 Tax=Xanthobacter flavus TaxID=281 RepID=UPI00372935EC
MSESGKDKLLSLLFGGEKELVNIKFFQGNSPSLTAAELCEEAYSAIVQACAADMQDNPPHSGMERVAYKQRLAI